MHIHRFVAYIRCILLSGLRQATAKLVERYRVHYDDPPYELFQTSFVLSLSPQNFVCPLDNIYKVLHRKGRFHVLYRHSGYSVSWKDALVVKASDRPLSTLPEKLRSGYAG